MYDVFPSCVSSRRATSINHVRIAKNRVHLELYMYYICIKNAPTSYNLFHTLPGPSTHQGTFATQDHHDEFNSLLYFFEKARQHVQQRMYWADPYHSGGLFRVRAISQPPHVYEHAMFEWCKTEFVNNPHTSKSLENTNDM
jgi:hypothetical protein